MRSNIMDKLQNSLLGKFNPKSPTSPTRRRTTIRSKSQTPEPSRIFEEIEAYEHSYMGTFANICFEVMKKLNKKKLR